MLIAKVAGATIVEPCPYYMTEFQLGLGDLTDGE